VVQKCKKTLKILKKYIIYGINNFNDLQWCTVNIFKNVSFFSKITRVPRQIEIPRNLLGIPKASLLIVATARYSDSSAFCGRI